MENKVKASYANIDILRLLFAVCILILHSLVYTLFPKTIAFAFEKGILRLAVPFFFICSGYFLGIKIKHSPVSAVIRNYISRLIIPFAFWEIINVCLEIIKLKICGNRIAPGEIVWRIIFYPYGAMWYVMACIIGALLLKPFIKNRRVKIAIIIGFLLYLWALSCNNYYFIAEKIGFSRFVDTYLELFLTARNGFFVGFFLLSIGIMTASLSSSITKHISKYAFVYLIISFILYISEVVIVRIAGGKPQDDGSLYIFSIPFICTLIITAVNKNNLIEIPGNLLRKASSSLYFQHRAWISTLQLLHIQNLLYIFGLSLVFSLVVSIIAIKIDNNKLNRLLF